jgi:Domain of unknown function (DUF4412)
MSSMVRNAALAVAGAALVSPSLHAQGGFEGVVSLALMGGKGGAPMDMVQMMKGTRTRSEMKSGGKTMVMITDMAAGTMTTLMPEQKMYMTFNMKQMSEGLAGMAAAMPGGGGNRRPSAAGAPMTPPKITATGKTETIAGRTCEHYVMGEKQEFDVCAAKGMGYFGMGGGSPMGPAGMGASALASALPPGWSDATKAYADGFFPLKMERLQGTARQTVMEVKSVEAKTLDSSLFVPPPDYKEMKLPTLPFGPKQ